MSRRVGSAPWASSSRTASTRPWKPALHSSTVSFTRPFARPCYTRPNLLLVIPPSPGCLPPPTHTSPLPHSGHAGRNPPVQRGGLGLVKVVDAAAGRNQELQDCGRLLTRGATRSSWRRQHGRRQQQQGSDLAGGSGAGGEGREGAGSRGSNGAQPALKQCLSSMRQQQQRQERRPWLVSTTVPKTN